MKIFGLVVLAGICCAIGEQSGKSDGGNKITASANDSEIAWINIKHAFGEDVPRPEVFIVCDSQRIWCDSTKDDCRYWDTPYQRQYIRQLINVPCRSKDDVALLIRFFPEKPNWKKVERGSIRFTIVRGNEEKEARTLSRERSLLLIEELSSYLKDRDVTALKNFMTQFSNSANAIGAVKPLK